LGVFFIRVPGIFSMERISRLCTKVHWSFTAFSFLLSDLWVGLRNPGSVR